MLTPIPGLTHLKVLVPSAPLIDVPPTAPRTTPITDSTQLSTSLVVVALEAAFGMRRANQLNANRFGMAVRTHIAARQRSGQRPEPVRMGALHLQEDGELFGTAHAGGRAYAFTGCVDKQRLLSFRVLSSPSANYPGDHPSRPTPRRFS
ncbi:hypothetical protein CATRI_03010 [Corynebacterium atrinae]|uniref:hypothetical protein n=1 Tax=Corynebacterium atrinae TaxID=1336740 RepID=UPI0025B3ADBE|nr:hypothetical protein [Corynebacterium atrinae]WJY62707.1 hypothetical protein CATRI_03010 [Corynebacterium atrinae]